MSFETHLRALAPSAHLVYARAFPHAKESCVRYGIDNALRIAHFFAQVLHESGGFRIREESLNYTPDNLVATFGARRISREIANRIGRTPRHPADQQAIANAIYGGEWGKKNLGNDQDGDGWKFRGRGPMQLTGRANYAKFGALLGVDLVGNPDRVLDPDMLFEIPAAYWRNRGCNAHADADDLRLVTIAINGGTIGIKDRETWLKRTKAINWLTGG